MKRFKQCLCFALVSMSWLGQSVALGAHPYHVSLTEIEWNAKTENFEVAVCLWPEDLEKALSAHEEKQINLDSTPNLDQVLSSYVQKTFKCHGNQHQTVLRWVGYEANNKQAWLYFELRPGNRAAIENEWTLRNGMLFELNGDQQNQINFSTGKRLDSGICSEANPDVVLQLKSNADANTRQRSGRS